MAKRRSRDSYRERRESDLVDVSGCHPGGSVATSGRAVAQGESQVGWQGKFAGEGKAHRNRRSSNDSLLPKSPQKTMSLAISDSESRPLGPTRRQQFANFRCARWESGNTRTDGPSSHFLGTGEPRGMARRACIGVISPRQDRCDKFWPTEWTAKRSRWSPLPSTGNSGF